MKLNVTKTVSAANYFLCQMRVTFLPINDKAEL